jgi:hypothetical protein
VTWRQFFIDDMQIGAAYTARAHAKYDLSVLRGRRRSFFNDNVSEIALVMYERFHLVASTSHVE